MKTFAAHVLLALSLSACVPVHAHRSARWIQAAPRSHGARVVIRDDTIPGDRIHAVRYRATQKLRGALRGALRDAGFRLVARAFSTAHDLALTVRVDAGVTTLRVERDGRVLDTIDVRAAVRDRRSDAREVAALLVQALGRSPRVAAELARNDSRSTLDELPDHPVEKELAVRREPAVLAALPEHASEKLQRPSNRRATFDELPKHAAEEQVSRRNERVTFDELPKHAAEERVSRRNERVTFEELPAPTKPAEVELAPVTNSLHATPNKPQSVVAVFDIEDVSHSFSPDTLDQLTDYLAAKVTEVLRERVVPRERIRARLVAEKAKGYLECNDERCQIALGRALSAQKSLATKLLRVGDTCAIIMSLYDLETELAERSASAEMECREDSLFVELGAIVERLESGKPAPRKIQPPPALVLEEPKLVSEPSKVLTNRNLAFAQLEAHEQPSALTKQMMELEQLKAGGQPNTLTNRMITLEQLETPKAHEQTNTLTNRMMNLEQPDEENELANRIMDLAVQSDEPQQETVRITTRTKTLPITGNSEKFTAQVELTATANLSTRPGLNIAFIIDNRLADAAKTIAEASRYLRPTDRLAIITYSTAPDVLFSSGTPRTEDEIHTALSILSPTGAPNIAGALDAALRDVTRNMRYDRATRLILISAGNLADTEAARRANELAAAQILRAGASLTTIAIGRSMLHRVAALGGGRHQEIDSLDTLDALLARELQSLGVQSIGDGVIELEPSAEAQFIEGPKRWAIGSLLVGESRTVPIGLRVRCTEPRAMALGSINVRYRDWSNEGRVVSKREELSVECAAQ